MTKNLKYIIISLAALLVLSIGVNIIQFYSESFKKNKAEKTLEQGVPTQQKLDELINIYKLNNNK